MIERLSAEQSAEPIAAGHRARYEWASQFVSPLDTVNDVGAGVGYGAQFFDADRYRCIDRPGIGSIGQFHMRGTGHVQHNGLDLDDPYLRLPPCDVAIAFEVLEHLRDPRAVAMEVSVTTRHTILVSVPTVPTVGANPYHRHDFTVDDVAPMFLGWYVAERWAQPEELSHVWRLVRGPVSVERLG